MLLFSNLAFFIYVLISVGFRYIMLIRFKFYNQYNVSIVSLELTIVVFSRLLKYILEVSIMHVHFSLFAHFFFFFFSYLHDFFNMFMLFIFTRFFIYSR